MSIEDKPEEIEPESKPEEVKPEDVEVTSSGGFWLGAIGGSDGE